MWLFSILIKKKLCDSVFSPKKVKKTSTLEETSIILYSTVIGSHTQISVAFVQFVKGSRCYRPTPRMGVCIPSPTCSVKALAMIYSVYRVIIQ